MDVLSFQFRETYSIWVAWTSCVGPSTGSVYKLTSRYFRLGGQSEESALTRAEGQRLQVRTVNGTATTVDYSELPVFLGLGSELMKDTHGGPGSDGYVDLYHDQVTDSSTIRWQDVPKIDDRPLAYVAAGSHGVWSYPGRHVYADVRLALIDSTVLMSRY